MASKRQAVLSRVKDGSWKRKLPMHYHTWTKIAEKSKVPTTHRMGECRWRRKTMPRTLRSNAMSGRWRGSKGFRQ